ncbi:hypothetical protein [uncultured Salinisphaera sp.]|uniref:hypothetical protein n=1 Tax=uncultured Salinisphaera sp. TaxID=359372 RepID=UPI0032B122F0
MFTARLSLFLLASGFAVSAMAADCANVVDATTEEMKAGSTAWSDQDASLVRSAAGAACVKTASGRYAESGNASACSAVTEDTLSEMQAGVSGGWSNAQAQLARSAAASACIKTGSGRYAAAATTPTTANAGTNADSKTSKNAIELVDDEQGRSGLRIGGVTIRPRSGPPGQKPYSHH